MAFFVKAGSTIKQAVSSKHAYIPSVFQTIRCMSRKVFVGGLSDNTDGPSLKEAFSKYRKVDDVKMISDKESANLQQWALVTFHTNLEATSAMQALDGQNLHGQAIRVTQANDDGGASNYDGGDSGGGDSGGSNGGDCGGFDGSSGVGDFGGFGGGDFGGGFGGGDLGGGFGGGDFGGGFGGGGGAC